MATDKATARLLLGSHVSAAGGFVKAMDRAEELGCGAMQVFVKWNTRWAAPAIGPDEAREFKRRLRVSPCVRACIAHAIYLVNLATADPELRAKSIADMAEELARCDALGIGALVLHPGSHGGDGVDAGIARVASALDEIAAATARGKCRILLETTAGAGNGLGASLEELAAIISAARRARRRLGVCADTAHLFAAGYDLRTRRSSLAVWRQLDRVIGFRLLGAVHLNDSKAALGSHRDRHEHIGRGLLGAEAFRFLVNDPRFRGIPMVLETEKDPEMENDRENLRVLREMQTR